MELNISDIKIRNPQLEIEVPEEEPKINVIRVEEKNVMCPEKWEADIPRRSLLFKENYLSEFLTSVEKEQAMHNLGVLDILNKIISRIVQANWEESDESDESYIRNKPNLLLYVNNAEYDNELKRINFKHDSTVKFYIDASDFVKDGMVSNVKIDIPQEGEYEGESCLIIEFNIDANKESIRIPIKRFFNSENYYSKEEADSIFIKGISLNNRSLSPDNNRIINLIIKPDWEESDSSDDSFILNKPYIPKKVSDLDNDAGYLTLHLDISGKADKVSGATNGDIVILDVNGNLKDGGKTVQLLVDIAEGKLKAYVTNLTNMPSLDDSDDEVIIESFIDKEGNSVTISNFKIGDIVYITDTDVPDRWVSELNLNEEPASITLSRLEVAKADIDSYIPNTRTIAGINLLNNITKASLLSALNIEGGAEVNVQADWETDNESDDSFIRNKPNIPIVGTLNTTASTAQSTNSSESLSGNVVLHKISKTGNYNDLSNKPTLLLFDNSISSSANLDYCTLTGIWKVVDTHLILIVKQDGTTTNNKFTGTVTQMMYGDSSILYRSQTFNEASLSPSGGPEMTIPWSSFSQLKQTDWEESDSDDLSYIKNKPGFDEVPTENSDNLITSGNLYNALANSGKQADWDESDSDDAAYILNKPFQGIDAAPTENSNNVVSSHGIYIAIASTLGLLNSILEYINYGTYNDNFSFDFPATFDSLS